MPLQLRQRQVLHALATAPAHMARLWNREFRDARLILEQDGDLRYLVITARVQRLVSRAAISCSMAIFFSVVALAATSVYLQTSKTELEASHRAIYAALLDSTFDMDAPGERDHSGQDMLLLARTIRERDQEIRQIVSAATDNLSDENASLHRHLKSSGLTESAVKVIQSNVALGGYSSDRDLDSHPDPLLRGAFVEESAKNRELKDILLALPSKMPVNDFYTTSHFGIRKHPISGRPRFHAGVDLVTRSDDSVFPVKAGKVILARHYNDYGNTVIVRHERGIETLYAHLARIDVQEGMEVEAQTVLGLVGNTGASTGKHLHFEVSVGGYPVDPLKVINTAQNVQQAQR
jgi:murein DD-endopeptidase MepM/ murein hydrolase activator NlpD